MGTLFTKGDGFCFENTFLFSQNFCPSQQRAFLTLFQLLQIYKSENENRLQFLSSLQKEQRFRRKRFIEQLY